MTLKSTLKSSLPLVFFVFVVAIHLLAVLVANKNHEILPTGIPEFDIGRQLGPLIK